MPLEVLSDLSGLPKQSIEAFGAPSSTSITRQFKSRDKMCSLRGAIR
ncbi:hypothetical protein PIIN_11657 [Serendipita indica DSM 11827]|uniref:Uncharacterized protein n=1 Tax=Serendipita indica (strain DSM 11827) TaxID=1109443 RepID=G4U286_SERID|nr:hypothetical protein PIIN_11657 [Serendipita indica DSM 11827]